MPDFAGKIYAKEKLEVIEGRMSYGAQPDIMLRAAANDLTENGKSSYYAARYGVTSLDELLSGDTRSIMALGQMLCDKGHACSYVELDKYFFELGLAAKKLHVVHNLEQMQTAAVSPATPLYLHLFDAGKIAVNSEGTEFNEKIHVPGRHLLWIVEEENNHNFNTWADYQKQCGSVCK